MLGSGANAPAPPPPPPPPPALVPPPPPAPGPWFEICSVLSLPRPSEAGSGRRRGGPERVRRGRRGRFGVRFRFFAARVYVCVWFFDFDSGWAVVSRGRGGGEVGREGHRRRGFPENNASVESCGLDNTDGNESENMREEKKQIVHISLRTARRKEETGEERRGRESERAGGVGEGEREREREKRGCRLTLERDNHDLIPAISTPLLDVVQAMDEHARIDDHTVGVLFGLSSSLRLSPSLSVLSMFRPSWNLPLSSNEMSFRFLMTLGPA